MAATADYDKILDALLADVKTISHTGIDNANIIRFQVPTADKLIPTPSNPSIIVSPFGGERLGHPNIPDTNLSYVIGYPCLICVLDPVNQDQTTRKDSHFQWRENIVQQYESSAYMLSITTSNGSIVDQTLDTMTFVDPGAWFDRNIFASPVLLIVWFRRRRRAS